MVPAATSRAGQRDLQHDAGARAQRQERRVGRAPLGPERRHDDRHHRVVLLEHPEQRRVEPAGAVAVGRRHELIVEAEAVEEGAQPGVVVRAQAGVRPERVGHRRQRPAEMVCQHGLLRQVVGHLAEAVHVVGKRDQPRRHVGQQAIGAPHHRRPHDLGEGADVRQTRRPVAGLEQHLALGRTVRIARDELARLLERPRGVGRRRGAVGGIDHRARVGKNRR